MQITDLIFGGVIITTLWAAKKHADMPRCSTYRTTSTKVTSNPSPDSEIEKHAEIQDEVARPQDS